MSASKRKARTAADDAAIAVDLERLFTEIEETGAQLQAMDEDWRVMAFELVDSFEDAHDEARAAGVLHVSSMPDGVDYELAVRMALDEVYPPPVESLPGRVTRTRKAAAR